MADNLPELVFDRTESDVQEYSEKGTLSVSQLNRVEQWTSYLAEQLRLYGYSVTIKSRGSEWSVKDKLTRSEADRIRQNIDLLQSSFVSLPDWRNIIYNNTLNYEQANALEWDLQRIYDYLDAMIKHFPFKQANTIFMTAGGIMNNA